MGVKSKLVSWLGGGKSERPGAVRTVSAITPSFNQAEFLGACIDSIARQTHPAIEHLVFDPGSTDGSREIAQKARSVTLVAEKDEGQADAIGRGMSRAKGDVIAWLNSDDEYADERVFEDVVARFNAEDAPDIVYGRGIYIDAEGNKTRDAYVNQKPESLPERLAHEVGILQPALFLKKSVVERIGIPDQSLHFGMDYEFWIRAMQAGMKFAFIDRVVARARYYEENKTLGKRGESYAEICAIVSEKYGFLDERWARRWAEFNVDGLDGVLKNSGNTDLSSEEAIVREQKRILSAFNERYAARKRLETRDIPAARQTADKMKELGLSLEQICKPVEHDTPTGAGWTCYTVGEQRWGFKTPWLQAQLIRSEEKIEELRNSRRGDTCVIVGNGPSLNDTDLSLLDGVDVFVSNYAPLKPELFDRATYLSVVNHLVAEQGATDFNRLRGVTKFFPFWLAYCIVPDEDTVFLKSVGKPEFSRDLMENVSWRHTVSFYHMQLAYGLGYRRVAMIGFDHSYRQDASVKEGEVIEQSSADENHFDPRYFKGKKWHAADVDNMEAMYRLAKDAFEADGREIVNATVGGHLELFRREELGAYLRSEEAKV